MKNLKKTEYVVEKILEAREEARKSDDILYLYVCEYLHNDVSSMSLKNFLTTRKDTGCPAFETVRRTRQKVFEKRPELKPEKVTEFRKNMEDVYFNYAVNG